MVLSDPALMDNLLGRVAALAATHRLPAMYNWKTLLLDSRVVACEDGVY
jgi:hypothetical protein